MTKSRFLLLIRKLSIAPLMKGCWRCSGTFIDAKVLAPKIQGSASSEMIALSARRPHITSPLACNLTRVFSYEWSANQSTTVYWEVGVNTEHHQFSHDAQGSQGFKDICRFIMQNCAKFAQLLHDQPEGDGTLLDRTLLLGTSEHANAAAHDYNDHPYFFVGTAAGKIKAGQHFRHPSPANNVDSPKVLFTALRAVGIERPQLGQQNSDAPRVATSTISELEA